jgi:dipeptidyl aminopeptidase/acylaminoacyl peptidase
MPITEISSQFGGKPWNKEALENTERSVGHCPPCSMTHDGLRFNPINYTHKWSVPQLIIHGRRDFRVNETESIAAFGALQSYVHFY